MNVLITHATKRGAISLIKVLKRISSLSLKVFGCDDVRIGYESGTLLVDTYILLDADESYIDQIKRICISHKIDILLSVMDEENILFAKHRNNLPVRYLPSIEVLELFHDKLQATLAIKDLGLHIPRIVHDLSLENKIIFRDKVSVGSRGIYIVDLNADKVIENRFKRNSFIQEYIDGQEYTVDVLADKKGVPSLIIPRWRIDIKDGISFVCQTVKHDAIILACQKIYEKYKIPGLSNVQFIMYNDEPYFIELNPRFAGTAIAGILSSFNYLELFLKHFCLDEQNPSYDALMKNVAWGSIISRYWAEALYHP